MPHRSHPFESAPGGKTNRTTTAENTTVQNAASSVASSKKLKSVRDIDYRQVTLQCPHRGHPPSAWPPDEINETPRATETVPAKTKHQAAAVSNQRRVANPINRPLTPTAIITGAVPRPKTTMVRPPHTTLCVLMARASTLYSSPHGRNPVKTPARNTPLALGRRRKCPKKPPAKQGPVEGAATRFGIKPAAHKP